jgi:hypothetical protein
MQMQPDDPLAKLRTLLPRAGQLKQTEDTGEMLRKLTAKLDRSASHVTAFEAACLGFSTLVARGSPTGDHVLADMRDIEPIGIDLAKAETLKELEDADGNLNDDLDKLKAFTRRFHEQCRSRIDDMVAPLRAVAAILEMLDDANAPGVRSFIDRADTIARKPTAELADALSSLLYDGKRLTEALPDFGEEPEVKRFLDALRDQSATIDLLTPEVFAWLAKRGALTKFAVSARSER